MKGMPTNEELIHIGRNFAVDMLQQAVESAKVPEQLNGQLHILNCCAIHLIATNIYNQCKSSNVTETHLIMEFKELLEDELKEIKDHTDQMELVKPKG